MDSAMRVSILLYTLEYPERTQRCIESLDRQRGIQTDIRLLADRDHLQQMKEQFPQIGQGQFYSAKKQEMSACISKAIQDCIYDNILFVSSDAVFEEDTLGKLLLSERNADGLVFNLCIVPPSLKCKTIYPTGVVSGDLFQSKELTLADQGQTFSAANIYDSFPNVWNHLYKKSILMQQKLQPDDFTRISQYYFVAKYHSYCKTLAVDTSLFVYREHQGEKMVPDTGFCIRHLAETRGLVKRSYERFTPDTVRLISNDFRVPIGQIRMAVKRKLGR